jgi:hypothetical protein
VAGVDTTIATVAEDGGISGKYTLTVPALSASDEITIAVSSTPFEIADFIFAAGETTKATVIA